MAYLITTGVFLALCIPVLLGAVRQKKSHAWASLGNAIIKVVLTGALVVGAFTSSAVALATEAPYRQAHLIVVILLAFPAVGVLGMILFVWVRKR